MQAMAASTSGTHHSAVSLPCCSSTGPQLVSSHRHSRRAVACGSQGSSSYSTRFRLEYQPPAQDPASGPGFHGRSVGQQADEDSLLEPPPMPSSSSSPHARAIRVGNRHAQAAYLTPFRMPHQRPLSNEEFFVVELKRDYNRDWPSVERRPDGQLVLRPGFLQLFVDPDVPNFFVYSGVERFVYSLPERGVQAAATLALAAGACWAFAALASQAPALAAAGLVSWLRGTLSLGRIAALLALSALDKMWLFWALLGGKVVDQVLARHAPPLRDLAWFWFKLLAAWIILTTSLAAPFPFWPFTPFPNGPFSYPFPIFRMGG